MKLAPGPGLRASALAAFVDRCTATGPHRESVIDGLAARASRTLFIFVAEMRSGTARNTSPISESSMTKSQRRPGDIRSGSTPLTPIVSGKITGEEKTNHVRNRACDATSEIDSARRAGSAGRCRGRQLHRSRDPRSCQSADPRGTRTVDRGHGLPALRFSLGLRVRTAPHRRGWVRACFSPWASAYGRSRS
ncbi:hypothetical protein ACVILL_008183 [Bradyrhizobium sp. USDA 3364]